MILCKPWSQGYSKINCVQFFEQLVADGCDYGNVDKHKCLPLMASISHCALTKDIFGVFSFVVVVVIALKREWGLVTM